PSILSQPRCAAHAVTAGAVRERSPLNNPMRKARSSVMAWSSFRHQIFTLLTSPSFILTSLAPHAGNIWPRFTSGLARLARVRRLIGHSNFSGVMGSSRTRFPVALNAAFAMAGATPTRASSPIPLRVDPATRDRLSGSADDNAAHGLSKAIASNGRGLLLHARGRWTRIAPVIFKAICSAVFVVCLLVLAACPVPPPQGGERSNPSSGPGGFEH